MWNKRNLNWFHIALLAILITGVGQTINTINQAYFDGVVVGPGDLDLNGNDIKMGAGLIGYDGTASEGFSFDTSGNVTFEATAGSLILPINNDAVTPTLAFGNGNTGLYESADDTLNYAMSGAESWEINAAYFGISTSAHPVIRDEVASATNPVYTFWGDTNTGSGWAGADAFSLIAGAVEGIRLTEDTNKLETWIMGSQKVNVTPITGATYTVLQTDYYLQCTYTATGTIAITLPAISTVGNGFLLIVKDSGYNANNFNITVARTGSDTINNVAGPYTISTAGTSISFIANATTTDWEIF